VGSGTSVVECYLAKFVVPNGRVVAVDFAHEMNREARNLAKKEQVQNIHFVTATAKKLPILNNSQNIIISCNVGLSPGYLNDFLPEARRSIVNSEKSRLILTGIVSEIEKLRGVFTILQNHGFELANEKFLRSSDSIIALISARPILKTKK